MVSYLNKLASFDSQSLIINMNFLTTVVAFDKPNVTLDAFRIILNCVHITVKICLKYFISI